MADSNCDYQSQTVTDSHQNSHCNSLNLWQTQTLSHVVPVSNWRRPRHYTFSAFQLLWDQDHSLWVAPNSDDHGVWSWFNQRTQIIDSLTYSKQVNYSPVNFTQSFNPTVKHLWALLIFKGHLKFWETSQESINVFSWICNVNHDGPTNQDTTVPFSGGSKISRRGRPPLRGAPTPDAATFCKNCMSKGKNQVPLKGGAGCAPWIRKCLLHFAYWSIFCALALTNLQSKRKW